VQYACGDTLPQLRDGYPTGTDTTQYANANQYSYRDFVDNNNDGTGRISQQTRNNVEYGMHENFEYYDNCQNRLRNKGLYIADRELNGNRCASGASGAARGTQGHSRPHLAALASPARTQRAHATVSSAPKSAITTPTGTPRLGATWLC